MALSSPLEDKNGHRREFMELVHRAVIKARQSGQPIPPYPTLNDAQALLKASINGKYKKLLKKIKAETDIESYGPFADFGKWDGSSYAGQNNLPAGHWVYVYPHWYIWEAQDVASAAPAPKE